MEIWKNIVGYENNYQISNLGRVKSLGRIKEIKYKNVEFSYFTKEKILKSSISSNGYLVVTLSVNKIKVSCTIHREVAIAFCANKEQKPQVNHINGIKTDNRFQNLEWTTAKENTRHAHEIGLCRSGNNHFMSKKLICTKTNTIYKTISEAQKTLGIHNLGMMLSGKRKNKTTLIYKNKLK